MSKGLANRKKKARQAEYYDNFPQQDEATALQLSFRHSSFLRYIAKKRQKTRKHQKRKKKERKKKRKKGKRKEKERKKTDKKSRITEHDS